MDGKLHAIQILLSTWFIDVSLWHGTVGSNFISLGFCHPGTGHFSESICIIGLVAVHAGIFGHSIWIESIWSKRL